jgi:uncharacterized protein YbjT (DUF2867 family)
MTILVIGGTGTLGRQIVKKTLDEGYLVKCLVRNFRRSVFLKDWGSDLVYGDLSKPSSIPLAFKGVHIVVDSATSRLFSNYNCAKVDGFGRLAILQVSSLAKIKKYIWFTLFLLEGSESKDQPLLLRLNGRIRKMLREGGSVNFTYIIFECFGFFQGLIKQFAIPILEAEKIWLFSSSTDIETIGLPYIDTRDAATTVVESFDSPVFVGGGVRTLANHVYTDNPDNPEMEGPLEIINLRTPAEIISICESLSGKSADIGLLPVSILRILEKILSFFNGTRNIGQAISLELFYKVEQLRVQKQDIVTATTLDLMVTCPETLEDPDILNTVILRTFNGMVHDEDRFRRANTEPIDYVVHERSTLLRLQEYLGEYFVQILKKIRELKYQERKSEQISFL